MFRNSIFGGTLAAALSLGVCAASGPASAAVIQVFSNDLAGWQAAAGGPVIVEDFTDATPVAGFSIVFGTLTPGGSISGGEYHDRSAFGFANPLLGFTPGVTAFGADWDMSPGGPGTGLSLFVTFTDMTTQTVLTEISGTLTGFFGIVSDMAIASIRLNQGTQPGSAETFDMDNARFVQATAAVPEPGTLALFGLGLAGLGFARRKKSA